jgi:hypothetical protein
VSSSLLTPWICHIDSQSAIMQSLRALSTDTMRKPLAPGAKEHKLNCRMNIIAYVAAILSDINNLTFSF